MRKRVAVMSGFLLVVVITLTGLLSGCTGSNEDPRKLLRQAVSSIVGQDDFTFVGSTSKHISGGSLEKAYTFMGSVSGHNDIYIEPLDNADSSTEGSELYANSDILHYSKVNKKWVIKGGSSKQLEPLYSLNPLIHADYLNRKAQNVSVETERSTSDVTILKASVENEQLLQAFQQRIRAEHEEVIASAQQELARHPDNAQLQEELSNYLAEAEQRLEDILGSLRIEANYRLAVANRSRQLNELEVHTEILYDIEGESRTEQIDTVYQFRK